MLNFADPPNASHAGTETHHPTYEELPREELSQEIEKISAEGIPADPGVGPRQIGLWIAGCVGALLLVALMIAIFVSPALGLGVALASLVVFAFNPELWANVLRAKERGEAQEQVEHHTPVGRG